jgi:hypothetical protein
MWLGDASSVGVHSDLSESSFFGGWWGGLLWCFTLFLLCFLTFDLFSNAVEFFFGFFLSLLFGLGLGVWGLFFLGWLLIAFGTDSFAVSLTVLGWDGTGVSRAGITLTWASWASELLLELPIPPVSFLKCSNKIALLWTNRSIVVSVAVFNSINIAAVDVAAGVVWARSRLIVVIRVLSFIAIGFLGETCRPNLSIEDLVGVLFVLISPLEPCLSLIIGSWEVLHIAIVWAHGCWVKVVCIFSLVGTNIGTVMVLILVNIEENVGVEAGVKLWVVHAFLSELNCANVAEEGHHC